MYSKKNYDSIDVMKFILSIMVAAIHINPVGDFHGYIMPLCRTAVPLFFMASGYFLFGKIQNSNKEEQLNIIKRFIIRNLKLYWIWFFVCLIINFNGYSYLEMGIYKFVLSFLFGGTFPASWYITALIIGTLIVFFLSKYIGNKVVFLGIIFYALCCLDSNYGGIFYELTPFKQINYYYPARIVNSFPVSIIWISIGRFFALRSGVFIKMKYAKIFLGTFAFAFFAEWIVVNKLHITIADDCYFMLVPLCMAIFYIMININITVKYTLYFRNISTIMYCLHISMANLLRTSFQAFGVVLGEGYIYIMVVIICILCAFMLNKVKNIRGLKWVRYMM